jgi:hypothetical protein
MIESMNDLFANGWESMDPGKQAEYGETFKEQAHYSFVEMPLIQTWNPVVVLEQVMKCLKMKRVPPDVLVGLDGRYQLPILRMVPGWFQDLAIKAFSPDSPAVMKSGA